MIPRHNAGRVNVLASFSCLHVSVRATTFTRSPKVFRGSRNIMLSQCCHPLDTCGARIFSARPCVGGNNATVWFPRREHCPLSSLNVVLLFTDIAFLHTLRTITSARYCKTVSFLVTQPPTPTPYLHRKNCMAPHLKVSRPAVTD